MKLSSATLLVVLATVIWGGTSPIMKFTLREVPIFTLAFIRMVIASAILGSIIFNNLKVKKEDFGRLFLTGITGVTLNIGLFFVGLKMAPAINAALIIASCPVLTLAITHFLLKEKVSKKLLAGSLVALTGVITIVGMPDGSTRTIVLIGNLLLFLSALSWVFYEIVSKKLLGTYSPSVVVFYSMAIGALTFFPFALWENLSNPYWFYKLSWPGFGGILYGIFLASLLAYWAWGRGLQKMPTGQAAFFFYLDPVSGAILSIILLGEKITPALVIGGVLIFSGVLMVEYHRKFHPLLKPRQLPS